MSLNPQDIIEFYSAQVRKCVLIYTIMCHAFRVHATTDNKRESIAHSSSTV